MEIKNSQKIVQKFLLVDSTSTLSRINDLKNDYQKIISFDLESDRILTNNSINHEISEKFLSEDELISIDPACIDFCQWYNKNDGNTMLSYEKINLGSLFRAEFNNFLVPFLKKKITLENILKKFPNADFLCSDMIYQILSSLTQNAHPLEENPNSEPKFDKIQYNITNSISVNISRENFQKLKKISELLTSILIKKNQKKSGEKNIALIEFDPVKYQTIFQESISLKERIFLYNRRRPMIHNRRSLKILKQSHVIPYITNKKSSQQSESSINIIKNEIIKKAEVFFQNDEFFDSFFQFQGTSFWQPLKPFLVHFFNTKIFDSIFEIENAKMFLADKKPSVIILLSENGTTEQIMLQITKESKIETILLQHGAMLDSPSAKNYNKILGGNLPIESSKFFAWGNTSAKYSLKSEIPNDKIIAVGSPNLDRIFLQKNDIIKKSNNVLLLATGPRNQQCVGHNVNEWKKYENLIKKICHIVSKNNLDLVIKRHPDMGEPEFSDDMFVEFPNVKVFKNTEISDLLLSANFVVSVGFSSSIFEAQILEKPVISIIADHDVYGSPNTVSQSCLETELINFEENFTKLINDSELYQQLVQKANNQLKENFNNIGQSAKKILNSLEN